MDCIILTGFGVLFRGYKRNARIFFYNYLTRPSHLVALIPHMKSESGWHFNLNTSAREKNLKLFNSVLTYRKH